MYLLEYLEKRLTGDAWTIGRQLMYLPWNCDLDLLKPHIPHDVFVRFAKVQRYCRSRIQPGTKARFLGLRFHYVALDAFVVTSPTQMEHAQSRLLEMHDSFVGQAVEDLSKEGQSLQSFSPQDQAAFISLYALSCFCLWVLAGIVIPRKGIIPCQIKHRVASLLPYFRDELDEYAKNKQLNKAVDQLLGSRAQFGDPVFLERIRASLKESGVSSTFLAKVDHRFLEENTGFIVIHTIENLDFALKNGVAFYEWNTFRNLLRGQLTSYSKERIDIMNLDLDGLPLDDPNRLSSVLMELVGKQDNENPLHPGRQLLFAMNSYLSVKEKWSITVGGCRIFDVNGAELTFPIL